MKRVLFRVFLCSWLGHTWSPSWADYKKELRCLYCGAHGNQKQFEDYVRSHKESIAKVKDNEIRPR